MIDEHQRWIDNPALKLEENASADVIASCRAKWQRDIKRNQAYLSIVEGILQEKPA